jgi:superfamily II DNA/RNA helicase
LDGEWRTVDREDIKKGVKDRKLRIVCATDAACEELNLQTLGALINVDLPWNPSKLEQRIGRIKRCGLRLQNGTSSSIVPTLSPRVSIKACGKYGRFCPGPLPYLISTG